MILFLLGFSLCLNIVFVIMGLKIYKKIVPVFKSSGVELDFFDKLSDFNV